MATKTATQASITAATAADIPTISALANAIWPLAYKDILAAEHIENMLARIYAPESLQAEMDAGHRFFLAYENNTPVAYASAYKAENTIWLKKLYVHPAHKGQGIGAALLEAVTQPHFPAAQIQLLVNKNNTPAQKFYAKNGFTQTGETPVQMGDFQFIDFIYSRPITEK